MLWVGLWDIYRDMDMGMYNVSVSVSGIVNVMGMLSVRDKYRDSVVVKARVRVMIGTCVCILL